MQQNTINFTHNEGDFRFLHICHVVKCEINPHVEKSKSVMYRNLKFVHMTDFSSMDTVCVSVTNIRYGLVTFRMWRSLYFLLIRTLLSRNVVFAVQALFLEFF